MFQRISRKFSTNLTQKIKTPSPPDMREQIKIHLFDYAPMYLGGVIMLFFIYSQVSTFSRIEKAKIERAKIEEANNKKILSSYDSRILCLAGYENIEYNDWNGYD